MSQLKITRISETKRGRMALFGDEEFLFSVDAETLYKNNIQEGSSLSHEELSLLKEESDTRKAKDQAIRYLSLRAYARKELYEKLCLKYDELSAKAAVDTMESLALLDDETFAMEKAKGMAGRRKSSLEIRRKLLELGIDRDIADAAVQAASISDEETALAIVERQYLQKLAAGQREKVMASLARRGFSSQVIRAAIGQALARLQQGEDE
ncbi:MAG: regulatory protein RecX [Oscillospiraceae bacterium]